jgi:hypothetical protein
VEVILTPGAKAVVMRLIDEVLNDGRLEVIDELYSPEMAAGARRWIEPFRVAFPDIDEVYFFTVRGGRIKEAWGLEDTAKRLRQLGL